MPPTDSDRALASDIGRAIVELGHGRVRRIVMIGSRAEGRPRPDSDLDLVVLVELPPGERPWKGEDFARSGLELQAVLGPRAVRPDLRVRSTDRFAEAKDVPGGVEWLAEHGGVVVFETPLVRAPTIRTSAADVRRELVSSWMHHAATALEEREVKGVPRPPHLIANSVFERLIAAILTHSGLPSRLDRNLSSYADQVPTSAGAIKSVLDGKIPQIASDPRGAALSAARAVFHHLSRDRQQARYLMRLRDRLDKIGG